MCNSKNSESAKGYYSRIKKMATKKSSYSLEIEYDGLPLILQEYIVKLDTYNDILTIQDFKELTGMGENAIFRKIKNNELQTILYHAQIHLIPKVWVLEYLCSKNFSDYLDYKEKTGGNHHEINE